MRKVVSVLFFMLSVYTVKAQELNATVTVSHQRVNVTNTQIFRTLENSLNEFLNGTRWSSQTFNQNEKIECSFFINVTAMSGSSFTATLQIQSSRPVYGSTYSTTVFNHLDRDFSFNYVEFENLFYNPNSFDSNLTSALAFYANIILGLDADTFVLNGGTPYYEAANAVVTIAQSSGFKGWSQQDGGNQNRFFLIQDLLSNSYSSFRKSLYQYHRQGLDMMNENVKTGKEGIKAAVITLEEVHNNRPNALLTRVFFDAKADELVSIFSGGPQVTIADLVDTLNRISPLNSSKWGNMRM